MTLRSPDIVPDAVATESLSDPAQLRTYLLSVRQTLLMQLAALEQLLDMPKTRLPKHQRRIEDPAHAQSHE